MDGVDSITMRKAKNKAIEYIESAKLASVLAIALDMKFEDLFYF